MIVDILSKLGFDWKVALANLVNFLIIFYLLRNLVFKKIGNAIKERQEKIQKGIEDSQKAEGALAMAEVEKNEIIKNALKESEKVSKEATIKGEAIINEAKIRGEEESEKIKTKATKEMERQSKDMEEKLQNKYVDFLIEGIEKVAMKKMDKKESEKFVESLLNK